MKVLLILFISLYLTRMYYKFCKGKNAYNYRGSNRNTQTRAL